MKNSFIVLLSIVSFWSVAQTRQNINKNTGTVSNVLTTIDSIRFNGSSTTMEVVLQNGTVESHSISEIQNVNFISASQHSCGATNVHNPNLNYGSMTDQEGNVYKTIVIGDQEWMAENLKTSHYRNGDPIATNLSDAEWGNTLITQLGAWAFYNNDSQYECPYGKLYNWFAVSDPRHVCPTGWHEPTEIEWTTLRNYLGGSGGKMKTMGLQYWFSPNQSATNVTGFSGLPGGSRSGEGSFNSFGFQGFWWSSYTNSTFPFSPTPFSNNLIFNLNHIGWGSNSGNSGFSVRCLSNAGSTLPLIITSSIANITGNSAFSGGDITSDGGAQITQRGVCWSTSPNPTTSDNITVNGIGIGSFTSNITDLAINTTYYVRAYANNSAGTSYGNQESFTTLNAIPHSCGSTNVHNPNLIYGSMTDQEGNVYKTIVIGSQEWMAENLKTSIYRNGNPIATNLTNAEWENTLNTQIGAWAFPNNDIQFECPYGKLYNWYAVADQRNVCPSGWHVPTDGEWTTLTDYLDGEAIAGGKMKTIGLSYWFSPNWNATNESGFSGLPAGIRNYDGTYFNIGTSGCWRSSSDAGSIFAWLRQLDYNYGDEDVHRASYNKQSGFSVRCLRGETTTGSTLPVITTSSIASITGSSALGGGNITSDGGAPVSQRGVCWSPNPNPTTSNSTTNDGIGSGTFTSNLTSLTSNTTYYVRAYAINSVGTAYGNQQSFTTVNSNIHSCGADSVHNPNLTYGIMSDQEGNTYKTIVIGNQEWMAENLKTSIYRNGDLIATNLTDTEWLNTLNTQNGAWVNYNNDSQFDCPYGKLYNWYAVIDSRHLCPNGWHEPTDGEWLSLTNYLGGTAASGGKMKSTGLQYWLSPNGGATNESGFSGLPGGMRWHGGPFFFNGYSGYWWSTSESSTDFAWIRNLNYSDGDATRTDLQKQRGLYVRCLKD